MNVIEPLLRPNREVLAHALRVQVLRRIIRERLPLRIPRQPIRRAILVLEVIRKPLHGRDAAMIRRSGAAKSVLLPVKPRIARPDRPGPGPLSIRREPHLPLLSPRPEQRNRPPPPTRPNKRRLRRHGRIRIGVAPPLREPLLKDPKPRHGVRHGRRLRRGRVRHDHPENDQQPAPDTTPRSMGLSHMRRYSLCQRPLTV